MKVLARWLVVGFWAFGATVAWAQSAPTQREVETWFKGPFVMLRGMYSGDHLAFDAQGALVGQADLLPLGLSAMQVTSVNLTDTQLTVTGVREGLDFEALPKPGQQPQFVTRPFDRRKKAQVNITIERDPTHPDALQPAIERVFSIGIDGELAASAPEYWRGWLIDHVHPELKSEATEKPKESGAMATRKGGKVNPPALIYSPSPRFTRSAKEAGINGTVVIGLIVDASGAPQQVHIVKPLGMGLDEEAVRDVSEYRFKPATYEGQPVPVEINIQVNFRID